jgi:hypothetical protein
MVMLDCKGNATLRRERFGKAKKSAPAEGGLTPGAKQERQESYATI